MSPESYSSSFVLIFFCQKQSECSQNVLRMQSERSQNVVRMQSDCSKNVVRIQLEYKHTVDKMQSDCSHNVAKKQPECAQNVARVQSSRMPPTAANGPRSTRKKNAPATTSRCQIATVSSVYLQLHAANRCPRAQIHLEIKLHPGLISSRMLPIAAQGSKSKEKKAHGDDESLSNSKCLERLREFQLKMHRGRRGSICLMYQQSE